MKVSKMIMIVGIAGLFLLPAVVKAKTGDPGKNVFVFKAEKDLVGGKVEVFAENGKLITAQTMEKRKMMIDFGDTKLGSYTIRLTKGDQVQEFHFVKK